MYTTDEDRKLQQGSVSSRQEVVTKLSLHTDYKKAYGTHTVQQSLYMYLPGGIMSAELLHYMYCMMVFQSRLAKTVGYKFYIVYARLMDVNGGRFLRGSLSPSAES